MNAYELADYMEIAPEYDWQSDAAKILRQQADRIAELEKAHPVKQLSDEEIEILASKHLCYQIEGSEVSGVYNFARAIIKEITE